jgi:hypothetical protein
MSGLKMKKTQVIHIKKNQELIRDPDYVYIGRGGIFGNPFSHIEISTAHVKVENRQEAIEKYKQWIYGEIKIEGIKPPTIEEIKKLRSKILGCFCKPLDCHGDFLAEIADQEQTK